VDRERADPERSSPQIAQAWMGITAIRTRSGLLLEFKSNQPNPFAQTTDGMKRKSAEESVSPIPIVSSREFGEEQSGIGRRNQDRVGRTATKGVGMA